MISKIVQCRICRNEQLEPVLALGDQVLTGVFPISRAAKVTSGPLELVKCMGTDDSCGLLQLAHSYDLDEMYGDNYGYRSGLNTSMVAHLTRKVERINTLVELTAGDLVIDIGSNDSTTLRAYGREDLVLVGIDPTGAKFREFYPSYVKLVPEFFSAESVAKAAPGHRAKVVTSFSMFYDLPEPMAFMQQVHDVLADDGIWVFEQSYMPLMLSTNSYDTVCHEHLEFYALRQIQWMAERVGLKIIDVEFNDVNGGSFSVTAKRAEPFAAIEPTVQAILDDEDKAGLSTLTPYQAFAERVAASRAELRDFLEQAVADGKSVAALGASTKGNVLLQYCDLDETLLQYVGEVNPDKFGKFTPGTLIPIVAQDQLLTGEYDYLLVLPWHFRKFFVESPVFADANLLFPLPTLEIVTPSKPN